MGQTPINAPGSEKPGKKRKSWVWWLAAVLSSVVFVFFVLSMLANYFMRHSQTDNDAAASALTRLLKICAVKYADENPDQGFPAEVALIGPMPKGSGCIDEVLLDATTSAPARARSGYHFQYLPGPPGDDGRITSFQILGRPATCGKYRTGTRSYFIDETGVLRFTNDPESCPQATKDDPPI